MWRNGTDHGFYTHSSPAFASSPELDFSLTDEIAQAASVRDEFLTTRNGTETFSSPQLMAEPYIPQGARCTDLSTIGDTVYIDYQLNNMRYIVAYYSDGTVQKGIRTIGSSDVYFVDSKNLAPQHTNVLETLQEMSISEEQAVCG